jgi:hypothetical protein
VAKVSTSACSEAEECWQKKIRKYARQYPSAYYFTPLVVASHGRLCVGSHALLNNLGGLASVTGRVAKVRGSSALCDSSTLRCARGMTLCSVRACIPSAALLASTQTRAAVPDTIEVSAAALPLSSLSLYPIRPLPAAAPQRPLLR